VYVYSAGGGGLLDGVNLTNPVVLQIGDPGNCASNTVRARLQNLNAFRMELYCRANLGSGVGVEQIQSYAGGVSPSVLAIDPGANVTFTHAALQGDSLFFGAGARLDIWGNSYTVEGVLLMDEGSTLSGHGPLIVNARRVMTNATITSNLYGLTLGGSGRMTNGTVQGVGVTLAGADTIGGTLVSSDNGLTLSGQGLITGATLHAAGNFIVRLGTPDLYTTGYALSGGAMHLDGNFEQKDGTPFRMDSVHTTTFDGGNPHSILFSDTSAAHFGSVETHGSVTFISDASFASNGVLSILGPATAIQAGKTVVVPWLYLISNPGQALLRVDGKLNGVLSCVNNVGNTATGTGSVNDGTTLPADFVAAHCVPPS
jgi:hypothetical protein